jgi:hypothetical protein
MLPAVSVCLCLCLCLCLVLCDVLIGLFAARCGAGLPLFALRVHDFQSNKTKSKQLTLAAMQSSDNPFYDAGAVAFYVDAGGYVPPTPFAERWVVAAVVRNHSKSQHYTASVLEMDDPSKPLLRATSSDEPSAAKAGGSDGAAQPTFTQYLLDSDTGEVSDDAAAVPPACVVRPLAPDHRACVDACLRCCAVVCCAVCVLCVCCGVCGVVWCRVLCLL